jgi:hypothetical protein
MSKRLQVVLDDREWAEIQAIAKRSGQSVSDWVRGALRAARRDEPTRSADRKLAALRAAVQYEGPTGGINQFNADIAAGHLTDLPE